MQIALKINWVFNRIIFILSILSNVAWIAKQYQRQVHLPIFTHDYPTYILHILYTIKPK